MLTMFLSLILPNKIVIPDLIWDPLRLVINKSLAACVVIVFFLSSCGSKQSSSSSPFLKDLTNKQQRAFVSGVEAINGLDIPVPLNYCLINQPSANYFVYGGKLSLKKLQEYYVREMERLGWNIVNFESDQEKLLVCNNVSHYCALSLRNVQRKYTTCVYVFLSSKHKKSVS
ncbi:MAG: hypothetical protein ABH827_03810 [bacterium]